MRVAAGAVPEELTFKCRAEVSDRCEAGWILSTCDGSKVGVGCSAGIFCRTARDFVRRTADRPTQPVGTPPGRYLAALSSDKEHFSSDDWSGYSNLALSLKH